MMFLNILFVIRYVIDFVYKRTSFHNFSQHNNFELFLTLTLRCSCPSLFVTGLKAIKLVVFLNVTAVHVQQKLILEPTKTSTQFTYIYPEPQASDLAKQK